jgi:hypothetical protein
MIFEALECRLLLVRRVPGRGQWCGRGLLAMTGTSGAPHSTNEEQPYLM